MEVSVHYTVEQLMWTLKKCNTCIIHTIEVQKSEHLVDPKVLCYTYTQAACNWLFEHVSCFRELAKKIEGDNAIMLGQLFDVRISEVTVIMYV